jgi:GT2 family glycosyltransferase
VIDVIIPVYGGVEQTRRCIDSVLSHNQAAAHEVVVIDDASPDPAITAYLDELAGQGRISLHRNDSNLGFVRSVNRGMALHGDRDVVLLNSDTEVANDWLDRLRAAACSAPHVATATPFSNNATICSYPFEGWGRGVPGTLGLARLDRLFATANAGRTLELPTAIGFCMYIRRECLDQLGLFDAERFGRGYGEENDFCMRALKAGWRHVLAADVFLYHEGSVSFSGERFELIKAATAALLAVHPEYTNRVHEFIKADPAAELRAAVDNARVAFGAEEARHVLAEHAEERRRLVNSMWEIDRLTAERETLTAERESLAGQVNQLNYAVDHAMNVLADRDRVIAKGEDQIAQLRAGLAHAESLAFSRQAELEALRSNLLIRLYERVRRRLVRSRP